MKLTKTYLRDLVYHVNGAAIEVHKNLGPGLLESIYHKCLEKELSIKDFNYKTELIIPISYKGLEIDANLRCDLFVENCLLVEIKSVEKITLTHKKQLLTYLKITDLKLGLLINFNEGLIRNGITRIVNRL